MRTGHRFRQFWFALTAAPHQEDLKQAHELLPPPLMDLFSRLQPSEQAHSLRIFRRLIEQGETNKDLLMATLLHDIGKSRCPLHLWERVMIVLAKKFFPEKASALGQGEPKGLRRVFAVAEQHAAWGAEMAAQAGAAPMVVALIRHHHDQQEKAEEAVLAQDDSSQSTVRERPSENRLLHCLQIFDNES